MKKMLGLLIALLIGCQLILTAAGGVAHDAHDSIHTIFSHDRKLEHHHNNLSAHFELTGSELNHQHIEDNFHPSALVADRDTPETLLMRKTYWTSTSETHPNAYLDGFLRPPRIIA